MQIFILILSFEILLVIIVFYIFLYKTKKMIKKFEERENILNQKYQEMIKILDLLSKDEDTRIFENDTEFQKWVEEIEDIATESIYETTFGEKKNNLYCILKKYEDWRKQKLR